MAENHQITVIDDDASMGLAIERLLMTAGWKSRLFSSAEDFINSEFFDRSDSLILDIQLPGMSGLELHQFMISSGVAIPVIFITGHDHPFLRSQANEAGAFAYFTKPFRGELLIQAVRRLVDAA